MEQPRPVAPADLTRRSTRAHQDYRLFRRELHMSGDVILVLIALAGTCLLLLYERWN
jgi:hypothetical protein